MVKCAKEELKIYAQLVISVLVFHPIQILRNFQHISVNKISCVMRTILLQLALQNILYIAQKDITVKMGLRYHVPKDIFANHIYLILKNARQDFTIIQKAKNNVRFARQEVTVLIQVWTTFIHVLQARYVLSLAWHFRQFSVLMAQFVYNLQ